MTPTSIPYLAALVSVVEEVRTRCPVKHRSVLMSSSTSSSSSSSSTTSSNSNPNHLSLSHYSAISIPVHLLRILQIPTVPTAPPSSNYRFFSNPGANSTLLTMLNITVLSIVDQKSWDASYADKDTKNQWNHDNNNDWNTIY